jgi:hypothetical protein
MENNGDVPDRTGLNDLVEISVLRGQLEERDARIAALSAFLANLDARLSEANKKVDDELLVLREKLSLRDAEIKELRETKTIDVVDDAVRRNYIAAVVGAVDARKNLKEKEAELEKLKARVQRVDGMEGRLERLCTKLRYLIRAGAAYQALTDKTVTAFINEHPELKEEQDKLLYIIRAGTAYQTVVDRTVEELIAAEEKAQQKTSLPVIDETTTETNPVNE